MKENFEKRKEELTAEFNKTKETLMQCEARLVQLQGAYQEIERLLAEAGKEESAPTP